MDIRLSDHFDKTTLQRGREYARGGLVVALEPLTNGALKGRVSNGRGNSYQQRITFGRGLVYGICSCPVGHNCKHVAAVLMKWAEQDDRHPTLAAPVQGWLGRIKESVATAQLPERRSEDYPDNVKDRLLYVLMPHGPQVKVDTYKGRINAVGTALNKGIRRYDALNALRNTAPAKFIRPVDLELLSGL
ncbi:MAG: SWIM zinc finger family protein, partial [Dehalococcoidia bacterium]